MNQLWRNHLLAMAVKEQCGYKHAYFSAVKHPRNKALEGVNGHLRIPIEANRAIGLTEIRVSLNMEIYSVVDL
jgi:hypothetical protein